MIIVFGSLNTDITFTVPHFSAPGETTLGESYQMNYGGKGANQALAAAKIGVKTALVGCVGDDGMGMRIQNGLKRQGVMTSGVAETSEKPTGLAVVTRDEKSGQNNIMVATGANAETKADQVPDEILKTGNVLLMQLEVPVEEVCALIPRAKERGVKVILNLAPVRGVIGKDILAQTDVLIMNQIEAAQIGHQLHIDAGAIKKAEDLARVLAKEIGVTCLVTFAENGSYAAKADGACYHVPALKIEKVVDTTGAGDAYCGTFAACIHDGKGLTEAMRYAAISGSLACTKEGAMPSYPFLGEIEEQLEILGETKSL